MSGLRVSGWTAGDNQIYENLIREALFRTRCCIPCIVQSYNSENNTIEAQPAIRERMINEDNTIQYLNLPLLVNVPVVFMSTQKASIQFPLEKGDECLVVFSDLSIDNFWQSGGVQNPVEVRRHDLSDGIAIPCCLSIPKKKEFFNGMLIKYGDTKVEMDGSELTIAGDAGEITLSQLVRLMRHVHKDSLGGTTSGPQ